MRATTLRRPTTDSDVEHWHDEPPSHKLGKIEGRWLLLPASAVSAQKTVYHLSSNDKSVTQKTAWNLQTNYNDRLYVDLQVLIRQQSATIRIGSIASIASAPVGSDTWIKCTHNLLQLIGDTVR